MRKRLLSLCHEPFLSPLQKKLTGPYGYIDEGSETMRGICTDNHDAGGEAFIVQEAVGLCISRAPATPADLDHEISGGARAAFRDTA